MPSGWKDSSVGAAPKVPGRTAKAAPKPSSPDLALELSRMRRSLEEVCKERDILKEQVLVMRSRAVSRAQGRAASPARPGSAPPTARRPSPQRKRLSKEDEQEMLRRLFGKSWRPNSESNLSGVQQLKKRIAGQDRKQRAATKPKCKVYQTREDMEAAAMQMFKDSVRRKKNFDEMIKTKQQAQVPASPKKRVLTSTERDFSAVRLQHSGAKPAVVRTPKRESGKPPWVPPKGARPNSARPAIYF